MKEYIRLEEEKAQRHGRTLNWQTATFWKVQSYKDEDDCFIDFETEFLAIFFDNTLTSDTTLLCAPTISSPNKNNIDFRISLDKSDDEDYTVSENDEILKPSSPELTVDCLADLDYFKDFENEFLAIVYNDGLTSKSDLDVEPLVEGYTKGIIHSYEQRLETIWSRPVNLVQVLDFEGLTPGMRMSDTDMGLDVADTLCFQLGGVRRRMTWRQFILALGLHTEQEMAEAGFGAYWDGINRLIPDKGDLRDYWIKISSNRDFLGPAPSYVLIRDPVRRLCHGMIAYSISGRGRHMGRHAEGRKSGARLSGGHFIGCLAMHFGLVSDEGLRGLQVVTRELPLIDLHELVRLNICSKYGDTWAWVAQGPKRQQVVAAGAHEADEAGLADDEGAQEIPVPT
ncbi:hypothetical protein Tco_1315342 [Tanacetum coccineum]